MNSISTQSPVAKKMIGASILAFFMLLTRGSHVLTSVSLPDASLAIFLFGGLLLKRTSWFALFFILAAFIDFTAASLDPAQGFCLTQGYWGLIPTYGVMWLAGVWLGNKPNAFNLLPYTLAGLISTAIAFIISTQSYYLFSGRFPNEGVLESLRHGWEYLPSYIGFTAIYLAAAWGLKHVISDLGFVTSSHKV